MYLFTVVACPSNFVMNKIYTFKHIFKFIFVYPVLFPRDKRVCLYYWHAMVYFCRNTSVLITSEHWKISCYKISKYGYILKLMPSVTEGNICTKAKVKAYFTAITYATKQLQTETKIAAVDDVLQWVLQYLNIAKKNYSR
jgi:hypothetical protein